ncbi:uncharacterized protein LOC135982657 isoform X4 [Chrysemys picta bellii]|uniref:uncharacterized protein LOC135982657 isoform X4 n=1 Tax=Chrysemys picta bellii TaxID=8478 RepID=UPI0032B1C84F
MADDRLMQDTALFSAWDGQWSLTERTTNQLTYISATANVSGSVNALLLAYKGTSQDLLKEIQTGCSTVSGAGTRGTRGAARPSGLK